MKGVLFLIFYGCILTMGLERHQIDIDHKILLSCISTRLQFSLKVKQSQTLCCQNKISVQLFCAACRVGLMALRAQEKLVAQEEGRHKVCVWETVWMCKEKTQSQCNKVPTLSACVWEWRVHLVDLVTVTQIIFWINIFVFFQAFFV